jgi:hypothetical protein
MQFESQIEAAKNELLRLTELGWLDPTSQVDGLYQAEPVNEANI